MPIFEYECNNCGRVFSALVGVISSPKPTECPHCNSDSLTKRVARFSKIRTADDRIDALSDEHQFGDIGTDHNAMRKFVHEMGSALDDEEMSSDFEEILDTETAKTRLRTLKNDDTVY